MKHKQHNENQLTGALLSQETLKSLLHYDPDTGMFTQLKARQGVRVGSIAGKVRNDGYVQIRINGKIYLAHRLAWLYVHGTFPPDMIDHMNRVTSDNRIGNLRLATDAENKQNRSMQINNTSGHVGVHWDKRYQKWQAYIKVNSKQIKIGYFTDINDAISARKAAELKYHTFQHN